MIAEKPTYSNSDFHGGKGTSLFGKGAGVSFVLVLVVILNVVSSKFQLHSVENGTPLVQVSEVRTASLVVSAKINPTSSSSPTSSSTSSNSSISNSSRSKLSLVDENEHLKSELNEMKRMMNYWKTKANQLELKQKQEVAEGSAAKPLLQRERQEQKQELQRNEEEKQQQQQLVQQQQNQQPQQRQEGQQHLRNKKPALPLCTMEQVQKGLWKPIRLDKPPFVPDYLQQVKLCYTYDEVKTASHWDTYEWEPSAAMEGKCDFPKFTNTEFCDRNKNKTIGFIGDSLTLEQFNYLVYRLGGTINVRDIWEKMKKSASKENTIAKVCNNETTLLYRRAFWIETVGGVLSKFDLDTLVLNTGAWYNPDKGFLNLVKRRYPAIQKWKARLREQGKDGHFIWRTTVPGHQTCERFTKPATNVAEMETLVANTSLYNPTQMKYHWYDFKHQNQLVLKSLKKSGIEHDVLPAYDVGILRPDDHKGDGDCLHSCPLSSRQEVFNQLYLHLTRLQQQQQQQHKNNTY